MKCSSIKIVLSIFMLVFCLKINGQRIKKKYVNYYNQEISCSDLQIDFDTNSIYAAGKSGIYLIEKGIVKEQIFNAYARSFYYDKKSNYLYSSKDQLNSYGAILHQDLIKINIATKAVNTIRVPVGLNSFIVNDNKLLNYGRLANTYDLIQLSSPNLTYEVFYTYLDDHDKLQTSKSPQFNREVDLRYRNLNDITYIFEGMYVNNQENKLRGIYSFDYQTETIKADFRFLDEKIIRSLNYGEGKYIAATADSIFSFNQNKILGKAALPTQFFDYAGQVPFEIFELDKDKFLIETHEKSRYKYSLFEFDAAAKTVKQFNDGFDRRPSSLAVIVDKEKNIWVGNFKKGLNLYFNNDDNYLIKHDFIGNTIKRLVRHNNELLLISNTIPNFDSKKIEIPKADELVSLETSKKNRYYLLYKNDINLSEEFPLRNLFEQKDHLPANTIYTITGTHAQYISDDYTFIENKKKICIVNENTGNYELYDKPLDFLTTDLHLVDNNLFLTTNKGIQIFDLTNKVFKTELFKNQEHIRFIKEKSKNKLLIVYKNRIELLNKSSLEKLQSTPLDYEITDLLIYNNHIWLATEKNGVIILNKDLEKIRRIYNPKYFSKVNQIREEVQLQKDAIFFATNNGLMLIDADKILLRKIKNTDFSLSKTNNELKLINESLTAPKIYFTKYKIDDDDWKEYKNNTINLNNLNHGNHNIEFKYYINNQWVSFIEQNFKVEKKWYKRTLPVTLIALACLALITIIMIFIAQRQNKRRKHTESILNQKIALESKLNNIQNSIAMDLHDNFGNRIAGISSISSVLQDLHENKKPDKSKIEKFIKHLEISVRQLDFDIKDLIWSNNPNNNQLNQLARRIDDFCDKIGSQLEDVIIDVELHSDQNYILPSYWNRQILLIAKEFINNAIKYSNSKTIIIRISASHYNFNLSCKDFGIGFDFDKLKRKSGLLNIVQRAESIECSIKINSEINKGTTVELLGEIPVIKQL